VEPSCLANQCGSCPTEMISPMSASPPITNNFYGGETQTQSKDKFWVEFSADQESPVMSGPTLVRLYFGGEMTKKRKKNDFLFPLTDAGNAELIASEFGESLRFNHRLKIWLIWKKTHWDRDRDGELIRIAKKCARLRRYSSPTRRTRRSQKDTCMGSRK